MCAPACIYVNYMVCTYVMENDTNSNLAKRKEKAYEWSRLRAATLMPSLR